MAILTWPPLPPVTNVRSSACQDGRAKRDGPDEAQGASESPAARGSGHTACHRRARLPLWPLICLDRRPRLTVSAIHHPAASTLTIRRPSHPSLHSPPPPSPADGAPTVCVALRPHDLQCLARKAPSVSAAPDSSPKILFPFSRPQEPSSSAVSVLLSSCWGNS